jgi:hypothetical protein
MPLPLLFEDEARSSEKDDPRIREYYLKVEGVVNDFWRVTGASYSKLHKLEDQILQMMRSHGYKGL